MPTRSLLLSGCAVAAITAGVQAQEVYSLQAGSYFEFGCHGGCECPIVINTPLAGTFRLTRDHSDQFLQSYFVTDVHWSTQSHDITGHGTFRLVGFPPQQELTLDLVIDGAEEQVESGLVGVPAQWPAISNTVGNLEPDPYCYDTAIFVNATPLPSHCSADFNNDGDAGTDADIEAFFSCLAGSCCATCGGADFNNDGDTGTDADIESFFRVLGGGVC